MGTRMKALMLGSLLGSMGWAIAAPAQDWQPPAALDAAGRVELANELRVGAASLEGLSRQVRQVARLATPSVVHIDANKVERVRGRAEQFEEAGSGVLIRVADRTWVLTNRHVIHGADTDQIKIKLHDGRILKPVNIIADAQTDVAVLEVLADDLTVADLGDSRHVEIGDFVVAIGSPFGLEHSLTFGIVSAKGRRDLTLGDQAIQLQDFFQTDAAINPGNSGGPLLNMRGEVIGVNTAIASSSGGSEGIGFTIPIHIALVVAEQLIEHGRMERGYLGVKLEANFPLSTAIAMGLQRPVGALVSGVDPESPAEAIGLQKGDLILKFDDQDVEDDDHLVTVVGLSPVGSEVPIVVLRKGRAYPTKISVVSRPTTTGGAAEAARDRGLRSAPADPLPYDAPASSR
jgi:serine protease Do